MKRRIVVLFLVVALLLLCMSGCASSQSADNAAASDMGSSGVAYYSSSGETMAPSENEEIETDILVETDDFTADTSISTIGDVSADRKIIRNADIELETKEFNASIEKLQNAVTELGGYISQANVYVYNSYYELHSANYTVRIPAEKFDQFIAYREEIGSVNSTNVWTDDVTDSYYDMEARLESLETKRTRLLELLEQAEDMESIISLESALSDTIYEIESITASLRRLDDQISYSTINVYINEVRETTESVTLPRTLGERISQQFQSTINGLADFGENFVVWIVGASPVLLILAVIIVAIVIVYKRGAAKRAVRREEKALKNAEAIARWRETHTDTPVVTHTMERPEQTQDDKRDENKE